MRGPTRFLPPPPPVSTCQLTHGTLAVPLAGRRQLKPKARQLPGAKDQGDLQLESDQWSDLCDAEIELSAPQWGWL